MLAPTSMKERIPLTPSRMTALTSGSHDAIVRIQLYITSSLAGIHKLPTSVFTQFNLTPCSALGSRDGKLRGSVSIEWVEAMMSLRAAYALFDARQSPTPLTNQFILSYASNTSSTPPLTKIFP